MEEIKGSKIPDWIKSPLFQAKMRMHAFKNYAAHKKQTKTCKVMFTDAREMAQQEKNSVIKLHDMARSISRVHK